MSVLIMCIACEVGDCDNCQPTPAPPGVLGGTTCPCDHNEADRSRRQKAVRDMFAGRALGRVHGELEPPEESIECVRLRLTDAPGDVVLLTVEKGTTFTDEELSALREFFLDVRARLADGDGEKGD